MSGLRIRAREQAVNEVQSAIGLAVEDVLDAADLTEWETVKVLTGAFNDLVAHRAKMGVRMERHGTHDKEGGLA